MGIEFFPNDILFGKLRPYLKNFLLSSFSGIAIGDFWVLHSDVIDSKYLYAYIQSSNFEAVANKTTGTKMPRADWNTVCSSSLCYTTNSNEQHLIGNLFKDLDSIIALHQRKCFAK